MERREQPNGSSLIRHSLLCIAPHRFISTPLNPFECDPER